MKKLYFCLTLLMLYGCTANSQISGSKVEPISNNCPAKPENSLDPSDVKSIVLKNQMLTESKIANQSKSVGYTFEGKAGQKLNYHTTNAICIWVFTPDNQLLNSGFLPNSGKYTIQVSAPQGSTTFDIAMGLDVVSPSPTSPPSSSATVTTPSGATNSSASASSSVSKPSSEQIANYKFPMSSCGDPLPANPNDYPVDFYPVYLPDSEANLQLARSRFCNDALSKKRKDSRTRAVQVAAFTSKQRAIEFRDILNSETSGASIASPTTIQNKP